MDFNIWFLIAGGLFVVMALAGTVLQRLPLTTAILYLGVGLALGPVGFGLLRPDPVDQAPILERLTEVAVLISLFTAGLKLRVPLTDPAWRQAARLAFGSMTITVGLIAVAGVIGLGLPWGAAILLGAILAPTDPVLAADVQVEHPHDRDRLRADLTGEAGLNDGTAFPFVMLGLGLLGLHDIGPFGWKWIAVDVLWAVSGGLAAGALIGTLVGHLVLYLRRNHREAVGLDDFLALGLIGLSYGGALLIHTYGFLAVFAAGVAVRRIERQHSGEEPAPDVKNLEPVGEAGEIATDPQKAPAYLASAVLTFNEQLERIGEVAVVVLIGALLVSRPFPLEAIWFVPFLLLVIRPLSVGLGLLGSRTSPLQRRLTAWFGIRGIGSLYYLLFAIQHGLPDDLAGRLTSLVLAVITTSVVVHGVSVTPLMKLYSRYARHGERSGTSFARSPAER
ncbi:MAG TPA: sodium:proton antiporter [Dehalococcoidia bacterium]|nr:sodium:proton antiporter [Dehalococcoidia bacterium]